MFFFKKNFACLFALSFLISSCETGFKKIFSTKSERELYIEKLSKSSRLLAEQWMHAGAFVVAHPLSLENSYSEKSRLTGQATDAVAWALKVKGGQKITVSGSVSGNPAPVIYTDLYASSAVPDNASSIIMAQGHTLNISVLRDEVYILRLQPRLGDTGSYSISILYEPLLRHPIDSSVNSSIGSYWGDDRDAGVRRHEGIDIFAKRRSLAVAAADGRISRVNETSIGGKVAWLQPEGQIFSVYYAHLDSQFVQAGQRVVAGEPLGWVGNTGNAKTTAPHLHFGIYTRQGAVNPLYFIKPSASPNVLKQAAPFTYWYRISSNTHLFTTPELANSTSAGKNQVVQLLARSANSVRVLLPDSTLAYLPANALSEKQKL